MKNLSENTLKASRKVLNERKVQQENLMKNIGKTFKRGAAAAGGAIRSISGKARKEALEEYEGNTDLIAKLLYQANREALREKDDQSAYESAQQARKVFDGLVKFRETNKEVQAMIAKKDERFTDNVQRDIISIMRIMRDIGIFQKPPTRGIQRTLDDLRDAMSAEYKEYNINKPRSRGRDMMPATIKGYDQGRDIGVDG